MASFPSPQGPSPVSRFSFLPLLAQSSPGASPPLPPLSWHLDVSQPSPRAPLSLFQPSPCLRLALSEPSLLLHLAPPRPLIPFPALSPRSPRIPRALFLLSPGLPPGLPQCASCPLSDCVGGGAAATWVRTGTCRHRLGSGNAGAKARLAGRVRRLGSGKGVAAVNGRAAAPHVKLRLHRRSCSTARTVEAE